LWYLVTTEPSKVKGEEVSIVLATYRKLGQWPAQTTDPAPEVEKAISEPTRALYRKALTTLSHGFGMGSLAYFRRIVEDSTGEILSTFLAAAKAEGDDDTIAAIESAMSSRAADERLKLAADALPATLRPGGVNPLSALYGHYSQGLHGLSDEECLIVAQQLHFCLEYIFRNWKLQMDEAATFRSQIAKWSDPKARPG
jgi:hypothetical protein